MSEYINPYKFSYDLKNPFEKAEPTKLSFDINFQVICKKETNNSKVVLMSISEDQKNWTCVNEDNSLFNITYSKELLMGKGKKKSVKENKICPKCNAPITNSKIICVICKKKIWNCCKIRFQCR